jgi:hypothetical protein
MLASGSKTRTAADQALEESGQIPLPSGFVAGSLSPSTTISDQLLKITSRHTRF